MTVSSVAAGCGATPQHQASGSHKMPAVHAHKAPTSRVHQKATSRVHRKPVSQVHHKPASQVHHEVAGHAHVHPGALHQRRAPRGAPRQSRDGGIHKIQHVVIIMQENRSFDSYSGTYPGADGIPMRHGVPTVCVPDAHTRRCVRPYHDRADLNYGGPHDASNAAADVAGGKMDGFIGQEQLGRKQACRNRFDPACAVARADTSPDVMGYHDGHDIPNYWAYAHNFVLQDHMFEPDASWSLPVHLFMVSAWSAICTRRGDPMSCHNALQWPDLPPDAVTEDPG